MSILRVEGLTKYYKDVKALDYVSFEFDKGILSFLGPSGCGKTTLLRSIAGLEIPDAGTISIADKVQTSVDRGILVPPYSREIGFVFQNYALWPHMTVFANIAFGLKLRKMPEAEIKRKVLTALELVGLQGLEQRYPSQLSGGQQQRVALARALVMSPEVLLLDEPLSNLDAKLRVSIRTELISIQRQLGLTTIYVTHDQDEALAMSDWVAVMNHGRVVQWGTPWEAYYQPRTPFMANFLGSVNLVRAPVLDAGPGSVVVRLGLQALELPVAAPVQGEQALLSIRPETLDFGEPGAGAGE